MRQSSLATLPLLCALAVHVQLGTSQLPPRIGEITVPGQPVNEKRLFCDARPLSGQPALPVENAEFYLNGSDVLRMLHGSEARFEDSGGRMTIVFQLTQELEGVYTCGNGTDYRSSNSLTFVSLPTRNSNIDMYYAVRVGGTVTLECGIKQGALGNSYSPMWTQDRFRDVDVDTPGSRFHINRRTLEDFTLTISPVHLIDNGTYVCLVDIVVDDQPDEFVESLVITLVVYEEPIITFLTEDQVQVVPSNASTSLTLEFICNATGGPNLKIEWKRNNKVIRNNEKYSVKSVEVSTTDRLMALHSVLTIKEPELADSGPIVCVVTTEYGKDTSTTVNNLIPEYRTVESVVNLIVLDSSLDPRPFPTQQDDLLVRIDLPPGAVISDEIRVRVRLTPEDDDDGEPLEMSVDGVFSNVSTFYPFIPASQLPFRQFGIQVSMIVNNKRGPFSPPQVNEAQFIDYDESESSTCDNTTIIIICAAGCVLAALVCIIYIVTCIVYVKRRNRKDKNKLEERRIQEETDRHMQPSGDATIDALRKTLNLLYEDLLTAPEKYVSFIMDRINHHERLFDSILGIQPPDVTERQRGTAAVRARSRRPRAAMVQPLSDGDDNSTPTIVGGHIMAAAIVGRGATPTDVGGHIMAEGPEDEDEDEDVAEKPMTEKERAQARLAQLIQRVESYKPQPQHIENPQPVCDGPHCEENEARAEEQLDRSATVHVEQHRQEQTLNTKESTV